MAKKKSKPVKTVPKEKKAVKKPIKKVKKEEEYDSSEDDNVENSFWEDESGIYDGCGGMKGHGGDSYSDSRE